MSGFKRMKTLMWAGAGALALAGAVALAHPGDPVAPPAAAFAPTAAAVPFELFRGQRILLTGQVNGTATEMMLDSGAGMTVIDRAFADRLGLAATQKIAVQGAGGSVPGEIAGNVTLSVGGLTLTRLNVLILDLADVARGVGRPMPVVLGREAFKAAAVTIDFPGRTIRFADRAGFRAPAGAARFELGEKGFLPRVKVAVAGLAPVEADLDLGNAGTLILAKSYWTRQPKLAALRQARSQSGGVGGLKAARRVTLPQVEFGGMRFADVPATLVDDRGALPEHGANVGLGLLKTAVVTIDFGGGALFVQPTAAAPSFQRDRAGVRAELAGDRIRIAYVSPDGPAAAADVTAGDEFVAIDGHRVGADYYTRPEWNLAEAGRTVALERADGRVVQMTLRDYY